MRRRVASVSVLAVLAGLTVGAPAEAADEFRTVTREGVVLQHHRVAKMGGPVKKIGIRVKATGLTRSDFDGDGVDDVAATGDPFETNLPHYPTGVVTVRYSSAPQVDYLLGVLSSDGGCGCFGIALVAGDFNGDGYDDLAVGDSDEVDPGTKVHAGGVWVIPGSRTGLVVDAATHFNQSSPGVPGDPANYDRFGSALAAGDINGDGRDDLAIGASGKSIGGAAEAGTVTVLLGGSGGLTATGARQLHQDQAAVPGSAERNDHFGFTLAIGKVNSDRYADLVNGAPHENDGVSWDGTGMVTLMWGSAAGVSLTGATSVTGAAVYGATGRSDTIAWYLGEALAIGDVDGDGLGEVVAGAPGAQTPHLNGGLVAVFTGRSAGLSGSAVRIITQRTVGVPGEPEDDDRFGATLATGDVDGDGRADVLVGTPGEAVGSTAEAGVVTLLKGSAGGLTGSGAQQFDQNHAAVPDSSERGDKFGASVALLSLDGVGGLDAVVASYGEEVAGDHPGYPSGSISSFRGSTGGLVPQSTSWSGLSVRTERVWPMRYGLRIAGPQSGGAVY
ncbi:VCBS repeat-containing protein [Micromonospora sp. NBC_01655]|uniref:FG-GAP-like repeat-containing protein n=1 Tax=Micromonospora sp. NBC_01655 TaxID=2975983 RepID=UPI0022590559|nr:FG-GAP-like repeat-containing protein [Micromonospora sp. NBC_01655]MCX4469537.1 VCBS repeat-containing protein [Micromonospora sp. NBC_01655]